MIKKNLLTLFFLIFFITIFSKVHVKVLAKTGDCFEYNGLLYTVTDEDKKLAAVGNPNSSNCLTDTSKDEITIPQKCKKPNGTKYKVNEIMDYAFEFCRSIKKISISKNIEKIGNNVFKQCNSLECIDVNRRNKNYCTENGILFSKKKDEIIKCTKNNKEKIYRVPDSVTKINDDAFSNTMLEKLIITKSVNFIGESSLDNCTYLNDIITEPGNKNFCSLDGVLFDINCTTLIKYPIAKPLVRYRMPDTVVNLAKSAFSYCNNLEEVVLSPNLKFINERAFENCEKLNHIIIPENVASIEKFAFANCNGLKSIVIPKNVQTISDCAFANCKNLEHLIIFNGIKSIGNFAFRNCNNLSICFYNMKNTDGISLGTDWSGSSKIYFNSDLCTPDTYNCKITEPKCCVNGIKIYTCKACGKEMHRETIPAKNHDFQKIIQSPTCTQCGFEFNRCKTCGYETPKLKNCDCLGHEFVEEKIEPTCSSEGCIIHKCIRCEERKRIKVLPPTLEHQESDWIVDKEATCTETGRCHTECTKCRKTLKETNIPALGHRYKVCMTTRPTCSSPGIRHYKCLHCGYEYTEPMPLKLPHKKSEWIIVKHPTFFEKGLKHKICTLCKKVLKKEEINPSSDTISLADFFNVSEPTAFYNPSQNTCKACEKEMHRETIPTKNHDFQKIIQSPTCTQCGFEFNRCKTCGYETPKLKNCDCLGHEFVEEKIKPTCSSEGCIIHKCIRCEERKRIKVLPPTLEHQESDWIVDKEATCTETGRCHTECTKCRKTLKETNIPALGHRYKVCMTTRPTCSSPGIRHYKCLHCGYEYTEPMPLKLPHKKSEWIIVKHPTFFEKGLKHKICTLCEKVLKEEEINPSSDAISLADFFNVSEPTAFYNSSQTKENLTEATVVKNKKDMLKTKSSIDCDNFIIEPEKNLHSKNLALKNEEQTNSNDKKASYIPPIYDPPAKDKPVKQDLSNTNLKILSKFNNEFNKTRLQSENNKKTKNIHKSSLNKHYKSYFDKNKVIKRKQNIIVKIQNHSSSKKTTFKCTSPSKKNISKYYTPINHFNTSDCDSHKVLFSLLATSLIVTVLIKKYKISRIK